MKDTPEEMQKIVGEVVDSITNPTYSAEQTWKEAQTTAMALGLVADKHNLPVRAVWDIVKRMQDDPNTPWEEPDVKIGEDHIFWGFMTEWDSLSNSPQ